MLFFLFHLTYLDLLFCLQVHRIHKTHSQLLDQVGLQWMVMATTAVILEALRESTDHRLCNAPPARVTPHLHIQVRLLGSYNYYIC